MTAQHPITPPAELVQQWRAAASNVPATLATPTDPRRDYIDFIAAKAAQWGADRELEACCEWIESEHGWDDAAVSRHLRAARRPAPKPPSEKEQTLLDLDWIQDNQSTTAYDDRFDRIRRALEQLDD